MAKILIIQDDPLMRRMYQSEHDPKQVADMVKEVLAGYTRNNIPKQPGIKNNRVENYL